jgi:hypothetical protein
MRACACERICAYACAPAPPSLLVYGERSPCGVPPIPASRGRQGGTTSPRRKRFTTLRQREMPVGASLPVDRIPRSIMQLSTADAAPGRARRRDMHCRRRGKRQRPALAMAASSSVSEVTSPTAMRRDGAAARQCAARARAGAEDSGIA